jgi:hypothetical protein
MDGIIQVLHWHSHAVLSTKLAAKGIATFGISPYEADDGNHLEVPNAISHVDLSIKASLLLAINLTEKHQI